MAKNNRGKGLVGKPNRGRGTCPVCGTKRIKLLYPALGDGFDGVNVCKRCRKKKLSED